jgi:ABC-type nickel/cobalt efflux system permease component RcnA
MEHNSEQPFTYQHAPQQQHEPTHEQPHHQQPAPAVPHPHPTHKTVSRSVAYILATITLLIAAGNLALLLILWANSMFTDGGIDFQAVAFPAATVIVALPICAAFLMDLTAAELKNPHLKLSPYKRYSAQFVKIIAFTACFFTLIALVFGIFLHAASSSNGNWLPRLFTDCFIILAVSGGLLAYAMANDRRKP